jgi:hypothetical protein
LENKLFHFCVPLLCPFGQHTEKQVIQVIIILYLFFIQKSIGFVPFVVGDQLAFQQLKERILLIQVITSSSPTLYSRSWWLLPNWEGFSSLPILSRASSWAIAFSSKEPLFLFPSSFLLISFLPLSLISESP